MRNYLIDSILVCLMIAGTVLFVPQADAGSGQIAITLNPVSGNMIEVDVANAQDLAAFEVEVSFNKTDFGFAGIDKGALLQQSFRNYNQLGPKFGKHGNGILFGFYSTGTQRGIDGNGQLALIKFSGDPKSLTIRKITATDSSGTVLNTQWKR